jgi:CRP/FNR family transcriptional regulator, cyclic AMP receptor protein
MPTELSYQPLIDRLSPAAQAELMSVARRHAFEDGQTIALEGTPGPPVCFLLRGTVRVYRTNLEGREQTLIHLAAGDALNMPAAFAGDHTAPASAVAIGPVELLAVSQADLRRLVSRSPEIALAVLCDLSEKLQHLTRLTYDLSLRTVRSRLARFLLDQRTAKSPAPVHWTHEQIAAQIGTVREVVSRTLRAFVRDGLIRFERQRIVLLNREALELEAKA